MKYIPNVCLPKQLANSWQNVESNSCQTHHWGCLPSHQVWRYCFKYMCSPAVQPLQDNVRRSCREGGMKIVYTLRSAGYCLFRSHLEVAQRYASKAEFVRCRQDIHISSIQTNRHIFSIQREKHRWQMNSVHTFLSQHQCLQFSRPALYCCV